MITNDCIEAVCEEVRAVGLSPTVGMAGKHAVVSWEHNGQKRDYFTASTPSDRRAHLNTRADVRRILRNDGLIVGEALPDVGDQPRLFLNDGRPFATSLDVAAHFGKAHKHVLRDIDRLLEDLGPDFGRSNFGPSSYLNQQNKQQRCFNLSRDGFTLLAMGSTGADAVSWKVRYLEAFNAMETELRRLMPALPADAMGRIEKLEGEFSAPVDLVFDQPQPEPGYIVVKAHKRRIRSSKTAIGDAI